MRLLAKVLELETNDPAVTEAFDQLVLRGQLAPGRPGWWELMGGSPVSWSGCSSVVARWLLSALCPRRFCSIPEKSIGATGFEPAT